MARARERPENVFVDVEFAMAMYSTGHYTIKQIAYLLGVSAGKTYYALRDAGCVFDHHRRTLLTEEERIRRSLAYRGRKLSEAHKKAISERNSCNYNGLNGYGHTKKHNTGYVIAYVPKHPHAHNDGYVMLHTILMERHLGRYLNDDEVVHHINHNREDNRIENLLLMDKKEHMSLHMKERHEQRRRLQSIS